MFIIIQNECIDTSIFKSMKLYIVPGIIAFIYQNPISGEDVELPVTFDDAFVVHDIKIIEGQNGLFIAMPSRKMGEGDFRDIAHPLVSETRNKIKEAIFAEYEKVLAEKSNSDEASED